VYIRRQGGRVPRSQASITSLFGIVGDRSMDCIVGKLASSVAKVDPLSNFLSSFSTGLNAAETWPTPREGCSTGPTSSADLRMGDSTKLNVLNMMIQLLLLWLHFSRLTLDVIIEPPVLVDTRSTSHKSHLTSSFQFQYPYFKVRLIVRMS
jgi:hypothetical protein